MKRVLLLSAALLSLTALPARALPVLDFQVGVHYAEPTSDMADAFDNGFGAYARLRAPVGPGRLAGAITWNSFDGKGGVDDVDFLTFQAGPHYSFSMVDVGLELAYLGEFEELGISPVVSVGLTKIEITAAYTTAFDNSDANWVTLGLGWRF